MATAISNYRAFYVGSNGRFLKIEHLNCASDADAIKEASRLTEQCDIEI